MNRSKSSLTISSGARTCTSASPQCGRSSRTSRARNANTRCVVALSALGWRDDQIIVIDNDQGESGASAAWREGFQRLVTDVGMGHAGIVMGLEVSRLARNNADWHRLLEICALADTLILDEDGVYDPASFNDRLLLGLKGTMSEAELHVLKARLRGGILNKARRGEYRCPLPTGFVYDEAGNVVLDPDAQIRETIAYFFETFSRVGSASQTVKVFRNEGLALSVSPPRRRHGRLPATDSIDCDAHAEQSAICGRLRVRTPTIPAGCRWQEDRFRGSASSVTGSLAFRMLIPATSVGSGFKRISKSSRATVAAYERGARVTAAGRGGATARTRRLRSVRKALPCPICHATRKAGSLVCL